LQNSLNQKIPTRTKRLAPKLTLPWPIKLSEASAQSNLQSGNGSKERTCMEPGCSFSPKATTPLTTTTENTGTIPGHAVTRPPELITSLIHIPPADDPTHLYSTTPKIKPERIKKWAEKGQKISRVGIRWSTANPVPLSHPILPHLDDNHHTPLLHRPPSPPSPSFAITSLRNLGPRWAALRFCQF
jgi:hypothetical protein